MFINIPNNFSSMWGELTFEYSTSDDSDIIIEIIDDVSGETIGVKKFNSTSTAKINVAPLLFEKWLPEATIKSSSGMSLPETGFPRIKASTEDAQSSAIYFTFCTEDVEAPTLLSTMPTERLLYTDECDQIAVVAPIGTTISYDIYCEPYDQNQEGEWKSSISSINGGARVFYLNANEYNQDYQKLTITIKQDNEEIGTVNYSLSGKASQGYRVAWISSKGSIEHYTFPLVTRQSRLSSGATSLTLRSAYGTAQEIEALSQIVSSPKVWKATSTGYTQIGVETTELEIREEGELMIANIKILENG